jgi:ABC-2 type transport system ATP-binding protein
MASAEAIVVKNLQKSFKDLKVLRGINFSVKRGTIMALLGPNGAGKTTTIRILSTLLEADGGTAKINGYDVVEHAGEVRESIGLTGQFAAVDEYLTGEENLRMIGRLYRMSKTDVTKRSKELLKQFDLVDAARRPVKTYSGGMKRRIDLAMSIIATPPVIFLDEPTTGLDPRSRLTMWTIIKKLVEGGTTILLTTQYMEEADNLADNLADNIVVIDGGKVIAEGDATTLKSRVGADRLELTISKKSSLEEAKAALKGEKMEINAETRVMSVAAKDGVGKLKQVLDRLEQANIMLESIDLRRPTLDDVFLTLTGHRATKETEPENGKKKGTK